MIGIAATITRVQGWAQQIRVANGYNTDIGAQVDTERVGDNGADKKLLCGVFLADLTPTNSTKQRRDWQLDIAVETRIPVRFTTAEAQAHAALEDMVHCIPTQIADADNNLATLELAGAGIDRQPEGVPYIVVSVTLRATVYEFISQPA